MTKSSGQYIQQPAGYRAFIPNPLLPNPPGFTSSNVQVLLSEADRAIGRLDAVTQLLPDPDRFVAMYVRKEAVLSSQIEGTQASLVDLLEYEVESVRNGKEADIKEVVNYVKAMNYGLDRLKTLPLSLRLIKEIHSELLKGVRGSEREPGEFRRNQNWIGPPGSTIAEALFIPPPPGEVVRTMGELEKFLHDETPMPPLIKCGLAHAQFETIHPFLDGNGRVGRLLITFLLCWYGILKRPLLYLSDYISRNKTEYYERLQSVRDHGDWEGWIKYFLEGVRTVSIEATERAHQILQLRDEHRALVSQRVRKSSSGLILLDYLLENPITTVNLVALAIGKSYPVANGLVGKFCELDLLKEITNRQRNRVYIYKLYIDLFK